MANQTGFVLDVSPMARQDVAKTLRHSREQFGDLAESRYDALLTQALRDLRADPKRQGAKPRSDLLTGLYAYHLASSRDRVSGGKVRTPRHFVLYRIEGQKVHVLRILHDSRDLARHLPSEE